MKELEETLVFVYNNTWVRIIMEERYLELIKIINEADYNYHTLDKPTITDQEYDSYLRELYNI